MGISIKREETEKLAREVASLTGASLTEAIHDALRDKLATLRPRPIDDAETRAAKREALFAKIRAMGPGNGNTRQQIESEMYGEFGEPI